MSSADTTLPIADRSRRKLEFDYSAASACR